MVKYHAHTFFYRSFSGYPWPENTKFGCVVRWTSASFSAYSFSLYIHISSSSFPSRGWLCTHVYWHSCLLLLLVSLRWKHRFLCCFFISPEHFSVSSSPAPTHSYFGSRLKLKSLSFSLYALPPFSWCYCSSLFVGGWRFFFPISDVFPLFSFLMHHSNPCFGKGVMDCIIMWVREVGSLFLGVNATIKINSTKVWWIKKRKYWQWIYFESSFDSHELSILHSSIRWLMGYHYKDDFSLFPYNSNWNQIRFSQSDTKKALFISFRENISLSLKSLFCLWMSQKASYQQELISYFSISDCVSRANIKATRADVWCGVDVKVFYFFRGNHWFSLLLLPATVYLLCRSSSMRKLFWRMERKWCSIIWFSLRSVFVRDIFPSVNFKTRLMLVKP